MDLRGQLLSVLLLLTASQVPPDAPDANPRILHGVWECSTGGDFNRLALDADGTYVEWLVPDRLSRMVARGFAGMWTFADDLLVLTPHLKHLTPGDGVDREIAIQDLEEAGQYGFAEELARTGQGWVAVSDKEATVDGYKIRGLSRRTLVMAQWGVVKADNEVKSVDLDIPCHRQTLQVKPALPAKV